MTPWQSQQNKITKFVDYTPPQEDIHWIGKKTNGDLITFCTTPYVSSVYDEATSLDRARRTERKIYIILETVQSGKGIWSITLNTLTL